MPDKPRKRPNGAGSVIWSAARERWLATVTTPAGKQVRKTVPPEIAGKDTAPHKKRALAWMLAWKADLWRPGPARTNRTMRVQLAAYLDHLRILDRKPRTLRSMGSIIDNALAPTIGDIPVQDLRAEHLRAAYQQFRETGRGAGYVHLAQAIVSGALKLALADGIVTANVASGVKIAPVPKRAPPIVGEHIPIERFLAAIDGSRFRAAYLVALTCGLRNHELRALRWADVDFAAGELRVTGGAQPGARGEVRGETKSAAGVRRIALGSFVATALRDQRKVVAELQIAAGPMWQANDLVWPSPTGTIVNEQLLRNELYRCLAVAGLPKVRPHDLKHAFVTNTLGAGVDLATVSRTAGHSSVGVTASVYSHATRRGDRAIAEAGDRLFGQGPKDAKERA